MSNRNFEKNDGSALWECLRTALADFGSFERKGGVLYLPRGVLSQWPGFAAATINRGMELGMV